MDLNRFNGNEHNRRTYALGEPVLERQLVTVRGGTLLRPVILLGAAAFESESEGKQDERSHMQLGAFVLCTGCGCAIPPGNQLRARRGGASIHIYSQNLRTPRRLPRSPPRQLLTPIPIPTICLSHRLARQRRQAHSAVGRWSSWPPASLRRGRRRHGHTSPSCTRRARAADSLCIGRPMTVK